MKLIVATGATILLSVLAVTTPSQAAVAPHTDEPVKSIVTIEDTGSITAYVG